MEKFVYEYATKVYFGEGAAREHLAAAVSAYGPNVMLAYGGGSVKKNGIYDEVKKILEDAGKKVTDFSGVMSNPTYAKVQEGAALAKKEKIDFILAVGGGSVIDCCKIVAAQAKTEEDLWEMEMSRHQFPTEVLPMGAIVTASGTGAEMNGGAVITNEEKVIKAGMAAAAPRFAILDPVYTSSVPRMQVISGAFDTLSHAMETYFGNSDQDNVSDDVALSIMRNTVVNMRRILKDINDMQARGNLMWDSAMAENGILKVGRVTDFQAHQLEHQLGAYTDCNHGQGLAVIHPAYYRHIVTDAGGILLFLENSPHHVRLFCGLFRGLCPAHHASVHSGGANQHPGRQLPADRLPGSAADVGEFSDQLHASGHGKRNPVGDSDLQPPGDSEYSAADSHEYTGGTVRNDLDTAAGGSDYASGLFWNVSAYGVG